MRVLLLVVMLLLGPIAAAAAAAAAASPPPAALLTAALDDYSAGRFIAARGRFNALADQGSSIAETMLGVLFARGQGVTADPATAVGYWLRAAHRGYPPAQLALAQALAKGDGVARDRDAGWLWASLAARSGDRAVAATAQALASDLRRTQPGPVAAGLDRQLAGWRPWASAED